MSFNYKNPLTPLSLLGNLSVQRNDIFGTNFSILSTGGYMEVYSLNDLLYTVTPTTGLVKYSGNTIPIQLNKGNGSPFSFDVLTLNSDNISSGRRRIGMLVYVIEDNQIYQYQIPNFETLFNAASGATGIGGPTVVFSEFGTTIKSNSPEGVNFISAWTANTIEGVSGETATTAVWRKLVTGGGVSGNYLPLSGGTVTGDTQFTSGLTANTISASTYYGLPIDVFVTGGTYNNITGTATFTNNTGGTFDVSGFYTGSTDIFVTGGTFDNNTETLTLKRNDGNDVIITGFTDIYTTGLTFDNGTYQLTISRNDGVSFSQDLSIFAGDLYVTGGTYNPSNGTATFTNNSGGTFNVTGFLTGFTDIYVTGGTFDNNTDTLTLNRTDGNNVTITGFTDYYVTGGTYANGVLTLVRQDGTVTIPGFPSASGSSNYYASFSDSGTQVVTSSNTPTVWSANTTEISNGIYIQDGTKITVSNSGIYEIGYSAQIEKTQGGSSSDVTIWAKINGNSVDRSSSTITLANNSIYQLPFVSYIFELNAGDYVEFYFSSPSQYVQLTTLSGLTSPTRPDSPSLIYVAKAIGNATIGTSGDSYVTGFTLNGSTLELGQNRVGMFSGFSVNLPFLPLTGGTITGSLSATTYYGDGSNLTGISRGGGGGAGGQLYYFNISNTQTPYYEFSTTATTNTEQSITQSITSNATQMIGGFMTPTSLPNITNFPAGIISFYLHCYTSNSSSNFSLYCQLYKRTTGGTETLLLTTENVTVTSSSPVMYITDAFFSGATLNSDDRLVVKVMATNNVNQTRSITLLSEGSLHYSFALTTIPSYSDTYVTGFTYNNNLLTIKQNNGQPDLTAVINSVTGWTVNGNLTVTGNTSVQGLTATTISASTYENLPQDIYVTGGTYSAGTATFTNNSGGTFNVSGFFTAFTGNTSGDCIGDIFVSRIHSCSPLYINPNDEGNIYFGSTSGVTFDLTNKRVGIGTPTPTAKLEVRAGGTNSATYSLKVKDFSDTVDLLSLDDTGIFRLNHPTYTGTFSIRMSANNTVVFDNSAIGNFIKFGPTNTIDTLGQNLYSGIRGASFGSTLFPVQVPYGVNIFALPAQSSGTTNVDALRINPTINNTGTYSGVYRGIYYNPTITSLTGTTHRAIETVSGDVIFGSTSGNVGIGTVSPSERLHVSGNTRVDGNLTVTGNTSVQSMTATTVTATTVSATTIGVYSGSVTMYSSNGPLPPTVSTPFTDDYTRGTLSPGGTPSLTYTNTNTGNGNSSIITNYLNINNGNVAGQSYTTVPLSGFSSPFNPTLSSNNPLSTIEWTFNLRTNRGSIFSGFLTGNYGGAVVLAGSNTNIQSAGSGYALVYGTTGTRNWKLVKYNNGLAGTQTDIVAGGTFSSNTSYVSAKIVYTPSASTWTYYFRDDGNTAWGDPTTVNTLVGSAVDSTYTSTLMSVFGVFFNYSTAANQNLQFDNLRVQQSITNPSTPVDELIVKNYSGSDVFKVKDDGTTTMSGSVTSTSGFFGSFSGTHLGNGSALVLGQSGVMLSGTSQLNLTSGTTALTLIPGLTTTVTVGSQTMVYIQTNGGVNTLATTTNGGSALDIAIIVDGAVLPAGGYQRIYADNPTGTPLATVPNWVANWNTSVLLTLSAGSHTIEVDAVYVAGSAASVSGGLNAVKQGTLTVMVLKNI